MPTIEVVYDPTAGTVQVTPQSLEIKAEPREPVVWTLQGLPEGAVAVLHWLSPLGGDPPLGPFNSLLYASSYIEGRGDAERAEARVYAYDVLVEKAAQGDAIARSARCTLATAAAEASTQPSAVVTYRDGRLEEVEPLVITASTGDVVTWFFEGFPEDLYPVIRFPAGPPFGPFASLTLSATAVTEGAGVRYTMTGAVASESKGLLHYIVEVRNADRQILAERHDPGIDNMGPPTPGGN